ncbi:DUF4440 domain-containing protein [Nitrosomonas oligotropha]|uniref:nuclear transport factor 2 family protein n=1 Tax=Nitrosomonas oligotropha TaxID=42354 RepID=UPI00136D11AA|nr:nuclear transport factor 2 family protein [Nitrosomonas oligotropha]MXS83900.1 nuclear transport factor 2 family protein [Nitrosomonas oligotropha]
MESNALAELIQQLELNLLQSDLTAHPGLIDELLAEDFEEIDHQGTIHSRNDVIDWLTRKDSHIHWVFKDFRIKVVSGDLVLAIYSLQKPDQPDQPDAGSGRSTRTSLWRYRNNQWKMVFHQASRKN